MQRLREKKGGRIVIGIFLLLIFLIFSCWTDIRHKKISIYLCIIFLLAGTGYHTFLHWKGEVNVCDIVAAIIPGMILIMLSLFTRQKIGLGDGMTVIIMGMFLGFEKTVISLMVGLFLSAIFSAILLLGRKVKKSYEIPFVPFLTLGVVWMMIER